MTKHELYQIDLHVDLDGPMAYFWRHKSKFEVSLAPGRGFYRVPIYASKERKRRFIERVTRAQRALCRDVEEVPA